MAAFAGAKLCLCCSPVYRCPGRLWATLPDKTSTCTFSRCHALALPVEVGSLLSPGRLCLEAFSGPHSKPETMRDWPYVDKDHY